MSQLIGGRYAIVNGERVLVADQFDAPVAGAPPAEPGPAETETPAAPATTVEED